MGGGGGRGEGLWSSDEGRGIFVSPTVSLGMGIGRRSGGDLGGTRVLCLRLIEGHVLRVYGQIVRRACCCGSRSTLVPREAYKKEFYDKTLLHDTGYGTGTTKDTADGPLRGRRHRTSRSLHDLALPSRNPPQREPAPRAPRAPPWRADKKESLSAWGGAVAGRAVLNGACVCVTATSVTAIRDHWVVLLIKKNLSPVYMRERFLLTNKKCVYVASL